jgi:hypothetical protein
VAKSTHAGIPWLRFIRQRLGQRVHFWSFDGWEIPSQPVKMTEAVSIAMTLQAMERRAL